MKFFDNVRSNIGLAQRLERLGDPLADPMFPRYLAEPKDEDQRTRQVERLQRARDVARGLCLLLVLLAAPAMAAPLACPPHPGPFGKSALSPDGRTLVCLVDAAVPGKYELYGVNGIASPWRISHNMADDRDVIAFAVSSDRVAFTSDFQRGGQWYELYSAPTSGSLPPVKLSGVTPFDHDVDDLAFSGDEKRVIYRKGRNATGAWELYSAPSNEFGGPPNKLISQPGIAAVQRGFQARGDLVRFAQDPSGSGVSTWYAAPVVGGAVWTEIFTDGFESGNQGGWR